MRAAVILLWTCCLWSICRGILCLIWAASPWRRALVLAVLVTALTCRRSPEEMRKNHQ